jgi:hypothetical protein
VDEHNRERFHALSLSTHVIGPIPDWLSAYAANKPVTVSRYIHTIYWSSFDNFDNFSLGYKLL